MTDIRATLAKTAGALVLAMQSGRVKDGDSIVFTGPWSHLGSHLFGAILDEANAALNIPADVPQTPKHFDKDGVELPDQCVPTVKGVLCYVNHGHAWFTTAPLNVQWGDDWDDAPYEHNAGSPYPIDGYDLVAVPFEAGEMEMPDSDCVNSRWSVRSINAGGTPWLKGADKAVMAGATFAEFQAALLSAGGTALAPWPSLPKVKQLEWHLILTLNGDAWSATYDEWESKRIVIRNLPMKDREARIEALKAEEQARFEAFIRGALET